MIEAFCLGLLWGLVPAAIVWMGSFAWDDVRGLRARGGE